MAELFSTVSQFKSQVGGAISTTLELDSIAPVVYDTARRHILPYLGAEYTNLVTAFDASSLSAAQTALLPFVRKPLALLTMHEYAKVAAIEFGEGGMHRNETETKKSAYRYQEKGYSNYMLEKGYESLELMLKFLSDNAATYTAWAASEESDMHRTPLLNYAADFRRLLNVQCDRWTFECLRPIISEVETAAVEAILPATFWTGYKSRHKGGTLTASEKELRTRIRKAIGHFAYAEATLQHWVQYNSGRIMVMEEFGEQSATNRTMPIQGVGAFHLNAQQLWADRNTAHWRQYILDNPSSFASVFDEDSGGSNTATDAWHINTSAEQATADAEDLLRKDSPAVWL